MALQMQFPSSMEFDFNSGRASPCGSSPSTPKGFGDYYFSAPTSPGCAIGVYREAEHFYGVGNYARGDASTSALPYNFPFPMNTSESKSLYSYKELSNDDIISKFETVSSPLLSPQSTHLVNTKHKKSFWSAFSPKRKKESDHESAVSSSKAARAKKLGRERAREGESSSRSGRRVTRSLSPLRESKYPWEDDEEQKSAQNTQDVTSTSKSPAASALTLLSSSSKGSRKWRLKDLLLFRSASEGRASDKDPLKKYTYLHRKHEVAKSLGSQATQDSSSVIPVRRGPISAHELHYTVNKAISQDMKRKSFLPYKQGILGRLAFNPTVHAMAHGFGSISS